MLQQRRFPLSCKRNSYARKAEGLVRSWSWASRDNGSPFFRAAANPKQHWCGVGSPDKLADFLLSARLGLAEDPGHFGHRAILVGRSSRASESRPRSCRTFWRPERLRARSGRPFRFWRAGLAVRTTRCTKITSSTPDSARSWHGTCVFGVEVFGGQPTCSAPPAKGAWREICREPLRQRH